MELDKRGQGFEGVHLSAGHNLSFVPRRPPLLSPSLAISRLCLAPCLGWHRKRRPVSVVSVCVCVSWNNLPPVLANGARPYRLAGRLFVGADLVKVSKLNAAVVFLFVVLFSYSRLFPSR